MGFDISKFAGTAAAFDEGVDVEIRHPITSEKLGLTVKVASYQSAKVRAVQRKMANTALREQSRNPKKVRTSEEIEERAKDVIAAAILDWSGFEKDGKPYPCTPEHVKAVVDDPDLWFIADQVDKAAEDQAAFIKA